MWRVRTHSKVIWVSCDHILLAVCTHVPHWRVSYAIASFVKQEGTGWITHGQIWLGTHYYSWSYHLTRNCNISRFPWKITEFKQLTGKKQTKNFYKMTMANYESIVPSWKFNITCNTISCLFSCKKCQFVISGPSCLLLLHFTCQHLAAVNWFNHLHYIYERRQHFMDGKHLRFYKYSKK